MQHGMGGTYLEGDKLCKALLQYRNTPSLRDELCPAQKLFGHPLQDTIPAHPKCFDPQWQPDRLEAAKRAERTQQSAATYYDPHTTTGLQSLCQRSTYVGSHVPLQDLRTKIWDMYGTVIGAGPHRKYEIKIVSGQILTRNCKFIKRRVPLLGQPESMCPVPQQNHDARTTQQLQSNTPTRNQPCRSGRQRKPTRRLIEDPSWNSDS